MTLGAKRDDSTSNILLIDLRLLLMEYLLMNWILRMPPKSCGSLLGIKSDEEIHESDS